MLDQVDPLRSDPGREVLSGIKLGNKPPCSKAVYLSVLGAGDRPQLPLCPASGLVKAHGLHLQETPPVLASPWG